MSNVELVQQQSYCPIEYDDRYNVTIKPVDDWEARVLDLTDKLIMSNNYKTHGDTQRIEDLVIEMYIEVAEEWKTIPPTLEDIETTVTQYNWEIILEMAAIEFANSYYNPAYYRTAESIHEGIADIANGWMEYWCNEYFGDMEYLLKEVFRTRKYCVEVKDEDDLKSFFEGCDVSVIENDCQNLILPEWKEIGQQYMDRYCHDVLDVTVLAR